ncbi:response regulator [Actinoplanes sp. NBRC 14428]|uniref:Two-component system response regulator n=1 Tax=Pseudosporangium ferrugineum TaxID=439699 RepID=A0A2T0SII5_9ACTN|nr:response regulator [Pseudosporangium ferrugineum]PRY33197.1 two-component system response regulator [Pseudosporangium ferrugineum]BCJ48810.1 response regulator [Actinoplanes sp. NBRC 14428]
MSDGPILLVEDNPDDVMFTLRAFEKNHIRNEIVVASDGEQALHRLFPSDGGPPLRPALILLDIQLPKVDGLEVLRRIRGDDRTASLPVVVLTTSNEERDIVDSYRLGANSFVRKPVMFAEFLAAANVLGMYWLMINEPAPSRTGG